MKKLIVLILMMALLTSVTVTANEVVPTLYKEEVSEEAVPVLISEIETTSEVITDGGIMPELIGNKKNSLFENGKVFVGTEEVVFDQGPMVKDGVVYLPLRYTLETLGFTVTWNNEERSIDVMKGARFTKLYLNRNYYSKNKMTPIELSGAPFAANGRTLVPVEFFYLILEESIRVENNEIHFNSDMMAIHSGYVQSIETDETGGIKIIISSKEVSEELYDQTYIHTNAMFTIYQKDIEEGEFINVLASPIMAMSIPGQTAGFVIY